MKRVVLILLGVILFPAVGFSLVMLGYFSGQKHMELLTVEIRSLPQVRVYVEKGWGFDDVVAAAWKGTDFPTRYPRQLLHEELRWMNNVPENGMLQEGTIAFVPGPPHH